MKSIRIFILCSVGLALVFTHAGQVLAKAPTTAKIAFTSNRDGNHEIYIMNPDGTVQKNLTRHKAGDVQPAWSPTGEEILFVSYRDGRPDLYLMDSDGTNVRKVFKNLKSRTAPAWSADGRQISYVRTDAVRELYIASLDKKIEKRIATVGRFDGYSNWSPDGTRIVFDAPLRQGHTTSRMHVFNLTTHQQEVLLGKVVLTSMNSPAWSPSGDKIVFTWLQGGNFAIYITDSGGNTPERIVVPLAGFSTAHPDWSPSGNTLVYEGYDLQSNNRQIYTVDLNGGEPEKLTRKGINFFADWFDPEYALPVQPQPHLLTTTWGNIKK